MSTATSRSATSIHPTRQQLDELEALMQRMLELPVNPVNEPTNGSSPAAAPDREAAPAHGDQWSEDYPPPPAEWGAVGLERLASELPLSGLSEPGTGRSDALIVPPATEWSDAGSFRGLAESEEVPPTAEQLEWAEVSAQTERSLLQNLGRQDGSEMRAADTGVPTSAEMTDAALLPATPPVPGWLRPLVWLNLAFDGPTYLFGPLGRWLRGPTGRALIGWIGMLLLAGAMAWAWFDWMGWTW